MFKSCKRPDQSTKDRLIETAAELLLRQSYGAVGVEGICKAADIKKGTFYHYFPSKVELSLAAYDFMWAKLKAIFDTCFDKQLTPQERLLRFTDGFYECQKKFHDEEGKIYGCLMANAGQEMSTQEEMIREKIKSLFDLQCEYYKGLVADWPGFEKKTAAECAQVACELQSYITGVQYQAKIANDPEIIKRDLLPGLTQLLSIPTIPQI